MSDVFTHAGPLGYLVLLGTILGFVAAAAAGGLAFTKRRVPLSAMILIPYGLLALGALGASFAMTGVLGAVSETEPNQIPVIAMGGAWNAMMVDWLARWGAAFVLVAATWGAAVGSALVPGAEPRFTPVAAAGGGGHERARRADHRAARVVRGPRHGGVHARAAAAHRRPGRGLRRHPGDRRTTTCSGSPACASSRR